MEAKALLPKSLFGRALLILLLPTVLIQLVVAYVFFDRHWDNVVRHMANSLAGEMTFFIRQLNHMPPEGKHALVRDFEQATGIDVYFDKPESWQPGYSTQEFPEFRARLKMKLREPFTLRKREDKGVIEVRVRQEHQVIRMETSVKRLESRTTTILITWMFGASALFLLIAVVFLRNQIRPIRRLAEAAENFGRGLESPGFRPHGASEVRKASKAFIIMRERIKRQLRTRTEMLAGISHDLRTPLTRMKLQLAMLEGDEAVTGLQDDVQQMEHMIAEYLDFARGEGREEAVKVPLHELVQDIVNDYERTQAPLRIVRLDEVGMDIRVSAFRRMLHNLIDNALRYGKECSVSLRAMTHACELWVDDKGPGIAPEKRAEVFKPFNRLDPSRNLKTGGVGLGLTIARDIVLAHGGSISLEDAPEGGLRVAIRLPL